MTIDFLSLTESHFPLLLKWLETPHVKFWWDKEIKWTLERIRQKYKTYTHGYKLICLPDKIAKKHIYAYIIIFNCIAIGYIQYYNQHDFLLTHESQFVNLTPTMDKRYYLNSLEL